MKAPQKAFCMKLQEKLQVALTEEAQETPVGRKLQVVLTEQEAQATPVGGSSR